MDYIDFHTQLQGVANSLGDELAEVLSASDKKLLSMLRTKLAGNISSEVSRAARFSGKFFINRLYPIEEIIFQTGFSG